MKKLIALTMAILMSLAFVAVTPVVAATTITPISASTTKAEEVLAALNVIEGYEDGLFHGERNITRAEATTIIARVLGQVGNIGGISTNYTDVPSTHWASGYIAFGTSYNILNGIGNNLFDPESSVTYNQFIKMIVCALGYGPAVNGTYPSGYLTIAAQKQLITGISMGGEKSITRGEIAQITYNALEVNLMKQTGFGTYVQYQEVKDSSLLNDYLKIKVYRGVAKPVEKTINRPDKVLLDERYTTNIDIKPGVLSKFYIYDGDSNNDDATVVYQEILSTNETLIINSGDIDTMDETLIKYFTNDGTKTRTARIDNDYFIIPNSDVVDFDNLTDLWAAVQDKEVALELIDSNNNGNYDFILAYGYKYGVVESMYENNERIYFANGVSILDLYNKIVTITSNGKTITLSDIAVGDVLEIAELNDVITITVMKNKVSGAISELWNSDGDIFYVINGVQYKLGPDVFEPAVGDYVVGYYDDNNVIVYIDEDSVNITSKQILVLAVGEYSSFGAEYQIKYVDENGNIKITKLRENSLIPDETDLPALYTYTSSSAGFRLTAVNTVAIPVDFSYNERTEKIGSKFVNNQTTVIFYDELNDEVQVTNKSALEDEAEYEGFYYARSNSMYIETLVITSSTAVTTYKTPIMVITSISQTLNNDGEKATRVTGFVGTTQISYMIDTNSNVSVSVDDIIMFKLNSKNYIYDITVLTPGVLVSKVEVISDDIVKRTGSVLTVTSGEMYNITKATIYYTDNRGYIKLGSSGDLVPDAIVDIVIIDDIVSVIVIR